MSSFGAETVTTAERDKRREEFRKTFNPSKKSLVSLYFDRNNPWILVQNGSLMGYFDWVPLSLRLGPWSPLAPIYLTLVCAAVVYTVPGRLFDASDEHEGQFTQAAFSCTWYYNTLACAWMSYILYRITRPAGKGGGGLFVLCTYTVQSWAVLVIRHALAVILPFLPPTISSHALMKLYNVLRFHALFTATVTFVMWNFLIAPFVYLFAMNTAAKRQQFIKWSFSFNLVQLHGFNIVFAVVNTVILAERSTIQRFHFRDLWVALCFAFMYSLFYVLVLDRFGVHLYPIFSPRSHYVVITWSMVFGMLYATYAGWNYLMEHNPWVHRMASLLIT